MDATTKAPDAAAAQQKRALDLLRKRRSAPKPRPVKDTWTVIQYTASAGYEAAGLFAGKDAAVAFAAATQQRLAGGGEYGSAFVAPVTGGKVFRGAPCFVTVRSAKNADAGWRVASVWPSASAARAFAGRAPRLAEGEITKRHEYAGGPVALAD